MATSDPPPYIEVVAGSSGYDGPYKAQHPTSGVVQTPGGGYVSSYGMQQSPATPMTVVTVVDSSEPQPPNYMWLACINFWLFGMITGIVSVVLSAASTQEYRDGNIKKARSFGSKSLRMSLAGMGFTIFTIAAMLLLHYGPTELWPEIVNSN